MRAHRLLLFLVWLCSLLAISVYGGAVSYGIFFFVSLLPVVSFVYLLCVYSRFRIYQEIESRNIVCRQPMPYYFVLQNSEQYAFAGISARLFGSLSYVEEMPEDVEYELLPGDRYTFRTRLVCKYRGEYEVGVKEIIITDFFRIFRLRYRLPSTIKALVYPRIIQKEELKTIQDISLYLCRESRRNQTEADVTVRDYLPGDALKYIQWKASAREQKLKIRNRVGEEQQGIVLFYDTKRYYAKPEDYLPLENQILELTLALGYFFAGRNAGFTVLHSAGTQQGSGLQSKLCQRSVTGIRDYEAFYQETAKVCFDERIESRELFVQLAMQGNMGESSVVIAILHEIDQMLINVAEELASAGMLLILYVVTDENIEQYVRQGSSRLRIIAVSVNAALEEWL